MKRNLYLKGRVMLNRDIISPEIPYAEFSQDLSLDTAKDLVNELNHGSEMLLLFEEYRTNLHISNVLEMLEKMESIYRSYDENRYAIKRGK